MKLLRPLGVYRPQGDTWLLADALRNAGIPPGGDVLEICCGTGALTIVAARTRPRSMTAVDVCRRAVLDRLCAHAFGLLAPGGSLLTVHSELCGVDITLNLLRETGLKASVVARAEEPFGPVMRRRADRLRDLGLIAPGQHHEELVVIRADRLLDND